MATELARMHPLQLLKRTGRDPEIHLCQGLHEVHRTIRSRGFKKIIDLIRVGRNRRYHLLLNYFISTALSAPGESAAERIHLGPDLQRQGNGPMISEPFSFSRICV